MREIAKGAADIGFVTPIYEKSGVDLTKAIIDFFGGSTPENNLKIFWDVYNAFPNSARSMRPSRLSRLTWVRRCV